MITQEILTALREVFKQQVEAMATADYDAQNRIDRNVIHAEKVIENSLVLAQTFDLQPEETRLAETVALFHDFGRFYQITNNFSEEEHPFDHAEAAITFLKGVTPFNKLEEPVRELIIKIITNHNKLTLSAKEDDQVLFYSHLLRDADKLDAWRMTIEYLGAPNRFPAPVQDLNLSTKPLVTEKVCDTILNNKMPAKEDLRTLNDYVLLQIFWVFDLNFKKSFQLLNQQQYMRHLYEALPKNDRVIEIYRKVKIHVENQIF